MPECIDIPVDAGPPKLAALVDEREIVLAAHREAHLRGARVSRMAGMQNNGEERAS